MSTLNQLTYSIINTINPNSIKGSPITKELVAFHIKNVRAQLARQQIGKYGTLDMQYIQHLGCIPLVLADKSECCEYPTGCKILRTTIPIPTTINGSTSLLTRVGPVDPSSRSFQHIEFERVPFEGYNRFTKDLIKWFIPNTSNYLFLLVRNNDLLDNSLEVIGAQGIFEDPQEVAKFHNCSTGEVCFNSDSKYPMPDSMTPIVQDIVIKNLLGIEIKQTIDTSNDGMINRHPQDIR